VAAITWNGRTIKWNTRTLQHPGGPTPVIMSSIFDQYVLMAEETTYGTAVTANKFVEAKSDEWSLQYDFRENVGFRPNRQGVIEDQHRTIVTGATGSIETCLFHRNMSPLLVNMLGSASSAAVPSASGAYKETYKTDDTGPAKSHTIQVARVGADGTARPYTYAGCVATGFEISCEAGDDPMMTVRYDAASEGTSGSVVNPTLPTGPPEPYAWEDFEIEVNSTDLDACMGFSITGDLGMKTDLQYLDGDNQKAMPRRAQLPVITGTLDCHLVAGSQNAYLDSKSGTARKLEIEGTFPTAITGTTYPSFKIIFPKVVFTGATPSMSLDDFTEVSLAFKAVWDPSDVLMQIEVVTADAALAF